MNSRLVRVVITNKRGRRQTVYRLPEKQTDSERPTKEIKEKMSAWVKSQPIQKWKEIYDSDYEQGKAAARIIQEEYNGNSNSFFHDWVYGEHEKQLGEYDPDRDINDTRSAFFRAGLEGSTKPYRVAGFRYGDRPKGDNGDGRSYNSMTNSPEEGISMAFIHGVSTKPVNSFAVMEYKERGRKKTWQTGYLVTHTTGGDGEPLIVGGKQL